MDEQIKDLFYEAIHGAFMNNREFTLEAKNFHSNDSKMGALVASGSDDTGLVLRVFPEFKTTETETSCGLCESDED